jgi:hypothetical protein
LFWYFTARAQASTGRHHHCCYNAGHRTNTPAEGRGHGFTALTGAGKTLS